MFAVINKSRMLNGWTTKTAQELDATIRTWAEVFDRYRIPYRHYDELYKRAFKWRVDQMHRDGKAEPMDAVMLAACWPGLSDELKSRMVAEGRYLEANAASDCERCFGSGMEVIPGKGARLCTHGNE